MKILMQIALLLEKICTLNRMIKINSILALAFYLTSNVISASTVEQIDRGPAGHIMVKAELTNFNGTTRAFRFLLDTGANITVLDKELVKEFSTDKNSPANILSSDNKAIQTSEILINRLELGGTQYDNLLAVEADISSTLGKFDDLPINGIIGMNILKFRSFIVDLANNQIEWDPTRESGFMILPLHWTKDNLPQIKISASGHSIWVICDLGDYGFISLLESDVRRLKTKEENIHGTPTTGIAGTIALQKDIVIDDKIKLAKGFWDKPKISISQNNDHGNLGLRAFWPKAFFNFPKGQIGLVCDEFGILPFAPPIKISLGLYWERVNGDHTLMVMAVKEGGIFDIAGLKSGDRILSLDEKGGSELTIKAFLEIEKSHDKHTITIIRNGKTIQIDVNSATTIKPN